MHTRLGLFCLFDVLIPLTSWSSKEYTLFVLKSVLSDISDSHYFMLKVYITFLFFVFNLSVFLIYKMRFLLAQNWFFHYIAWQFLLIGVFRSFIFNIIIDIIGFKWSACYVFLLWYLCDFFPFLLFLISFGLSIFRLPFHLWHWLISYTFLFCF